MWRLQHGELPSAKAHHPKVVVIEVGTNGKLLHLGILSDGNQGLVKGSGFIPSTRQIQAPVKIMTCCADVTCHNSADIVGECTVATGEKLVAGMEKLLVEVHQKLPLTHILVVAVLPKASTSTACPCLSDKSFVSLTFGAVLHSFQMTFSVGLLPVEGR